MALLLLDILKVEGEGVDLSVQIDGLLLFVYLFILCLLSRVVYSSI